MLRNMVTSFLKYEKVKTTDVKAKELKKVAEKMITLGKRGDLHARRQALAFVRDPAVVAKLFSELSDRYRERPGDTRESSRWGIGRAIMRLCPASN